MFLISTLKMLMLQLMPPMFILRVLIFFFSDNHFVGQTPLSILPPDVRRRAGRPKKQRIPSSGEHVKRRGHCGNCGQFGHNKRSCTSHGPESVAQYSRTESFQLY